MSLQLDAYPVLYILLLRPWLPFHRSLRDRKVEGRVGNERRRLDWKSCNHFYSYSWIRLWFSH